MKRTDAGFTLVEALVAMVIFAIAAAATASLMFHSTSHIARSNEWSQAVAIAQQAIEDIRTLDYEDMESGSGTAPWKGQSAFFTVNWDISKDDPEPGMKTVLISVSWEHKGATKTYETQSVYTDIDS
jgi:type II secretion system protein I